MRYILSAILVSAIAVSAHSTNASAAQNLLSAGSLTGFASSLAKREPHYPVQRVQADKALATAIQLELNRLGCEPGVADGLWGPGSKRALDRYFSKVGSTETERDPTTELLDTLRRENGRLCTLPPGIVAGEDRSATSHLEAVKYSYTVWSTLPSNIASEKTEYGTLRCEAGRGSAPRKCSWQ